ncbi:autotransporter outer membrane beta-barrel domain-containing protein [Bartonella sp. CL100XZDX]|uniref:autotransporter outer membrane beta-barrel domain-containing protein n=1 Tax=Bartonella sp. CL100XZDX TaxID=3243515 RepID=UPI0035CF8A26
MCKKSLLSCTAVIAVMLFNTHLNVYAETLEVSGEKKEVSNTTYEIINAKDNGEITGTHLTVVGNKDTDIYAVTADGFGSAITLLQDTAIKGTDFDIRLGLNAKDGATIKMTGGIITVSEIGAFFENSMNDKNKLEGVTISSGKDDHFMDKGINADNKSKLTLENVTVTQANTSIFANDHSEITILGGAFDGELKGISATEGSAITLTYSELADNKKGSVQVTSSHGDGLYANGAQSTITMIGGSVTGKNTALLAENGGHIDVTDVTLKKDGTGIGAIANDVDSTIELHGNTVINDAVIGLYATNGSIITMTGGTITAFETGAFFNESKSDKNKLENVTITYANTSISDQDKLENVKTSDNELDPGWESELENEKEEFLYTGITAFAGSHLTLENVTITQADTSISAEDGSQVTILGGAFDGEYTGLSVMNGSFITLANSKEGSVQVTSSNGDGLYADGLFSTIIMMGGTVTAGNRALFAQKGGYIKVTDVALTTMDGNGNGAASTDPYSFIELDGETTITNAINGLDAENSGVIIMTGGAVTAKSAALFTMNGGYIKVTGVALTTMDGNGYGAASTDPESLIELDGNTTINNALIGLYTENSGNIAMAGGTVTGKSAAVLTKSGGHIKVTDVALTTMDGNGYGAATSDPESLIELHGKTTINNAFIGLYTENSGTITMAGGTVTATNMPLFAKSGGYIKVTDVALTTMDGNGYGAATSDPESLIELHGKTTINNAFIGLYTENSGTITMAGGTVTATNMPLFAKSGGYIKVTDVALTTMDGNGYGAATTDPDSLIELDGKTTINNAFIGLYTENSGTITMAGGTVTATNMPLFAKSGGYIKVTDVALTTMDGNGYGAATTDPDSLIELDGKTTINNAFIGLYTENSGTITMAGGTVTATNMPLFAKSGGYIKVTDVALTTMDGNGYGAATTDPDSLIELDGKTTINNAFIGLNTENSGTITMAGGTVTATNMALLAKSGGHIKLTDVALTTMYGNGYGAATTDPDSLIELDGKTTINNAFIGLNAENSGAITMAGGTVTATNMALLAKSGGHIKVTDVALTTMYGNGYGAATTDPDSLIELDGKTTINNAFIGLNAENSGAITMAGGTVTATNMALLAKSGGHIKVTDVALTTMDSNGYGAATTDPDSLIELDGKTTINNAFIGLNAENSGAITMAGGTVTATNMALLAKSGGHIKVTDVALTTMDSNGYGAATTDPDSLIELDGKTTINNAFIGLNAENSGTITMAGGAVTATNVAVLAKSGGHIKVTDVALTTKNGNYGAAATDPESLIELYGKTTINNAVTGLDAENSGTIIMTGGTVTAKTMALFAMNGGHIKVTDVALTTMDGNGYGAAASNPYSLIELHGNTAISNTFIGLYAENGGTIKMNGGTVAAKGSAFVLKNSGYIDVTNVSATAENSGITFDKSEDDNALEINLTNTKIRTENSIGINADQSIGIANLKNSEISADILLAAKASTKENNFAFTLNANHSVLKGRAKIAENRTVRFDLTNKTTWILKTSTKETDDDGKLLAIAQRSRSDISVLNLNDSSIVFNEPVEDHYHTLYIGSGIPNILAVYNASGEAEIHFNAIWSDGVAIDAQKTDRLLIHGDVAGTTTVYVKNVSGDKESVENASDPSNIGGLSLIQVSGEAKEDSFKLKNGYTTIGGTPYKYTLTAYGPVSSYGKANANQNLFDEKDKDFWDFRLQPEFFDPDSKVRAVVPQMASYLVMPNALFYTGLADMAKQNALLANMRTTVLGEQKNLKNSFFLSTYGGTGTLSSKRGPLKYGYGADIRYAAIQGGVALTTLEGHSTTTHLGLLGTYGQLSFTPKEMQDASKNTLDKWSLTAYGSVQHDSGFYIDTLLSYGIIKGDITNAIIGKTAKLNNVKMLSISTTVGKQFSTGMEGLTFEPQIQLAYQHLMFDTIEDADNLKIDMNNPSQWLIRVGGRLTKTIMTTENGPAISFYGKANLIKTFGDDGTIQIGRDFDLDPIGTAIEGGVGINAQLSHNFSLYGDVSYRQKLQKTGISGASFSGGIRYQF